MKSWRRRFQAFWMSSDNKPKGKDKRYIEKQNRHEAKREIQKQIEEEDGSDTIRQGCDNCDCNRCDK